MTILTSLIASGLDLGALETVSTPKFGGLKIGAILSSFIGTYLFPIAGFVLLGMAVAGGYQYMMSYGDPKLIKSAKERITYGIIGFIVIFASYWFVRIMGRILDIEEIKKIFGA